MKKLVLTAMVGLGLAAALGGCARPGEWGWTPVYTATEINQRVARNWDYDGKQAVDDTYYIMLIDQPSHLTIWNVR